MPELLLKTIRSNTVDAEFFGYIFHKKRDDGKTRPFFTRSLAKPFQASVMADIGLDKILTPKQIAISSASHIGEDIHTREVLGILKKFDLNETHLQCGIHPPLSAHIKHPTPLRNNCSGKHALMLAACVHKGWDIENYLDINHPLQKLIFKKHQELCEIKDPILSKDGCGAPIWAMPLKNIAKGYMNLFLNDKYAPLKNAFLNFPNLIGGVGRLDSEIIKKGCGKLIAKVGAGGFLAVVNLCEKDILIIKMSQDNNLPRAIAASCALLQLNWLTEAQADMNIYTNKNEPVANYVECFKLLV